MPQSLKEQQMPQLDWEKFSSLLGIAGGMTGIGALIKHFFASAGDRMEDRRKDKDELRAEFTRQIQALSQEIVGLKRQVEDLTRRLEWEQRGRMFAESLISRLRWEFDDLLRTAKIVVRDNRDSRCAPSSILDEIDSRPDSAAIITQMQQAVREAAPQAAPQAGSTADGQEPKQEPQQEPKTA